jgi:hypothetical protein
LQEVLVVADTFSIIGTIEQVLIYQGAS